MCSSKSAGVGIVKCPRVPSTVTVAFSISDIMSRPKALSFSCALASNGSRLDAWSYPCLSPVFHLSFTCLSPVFRLTLEGERQRAQSFHSRCHSVISVFQNVSEAVICPLLVGSERQLAILLKSGFSHKRSCLLINVCGTTMNYMWKITELIRGLGVLVCDGFVQSDKSLITL